MKLKHMLPATWLALAASMSAQAQQSARPTGYTFVDLGPAETPFSTGYVLNNYGVVAGSDTATDGTSHAVLWYQNRMLDIAQLAESRQPGLLGANSFAGAINSSTQVVIAGETQLPDPNNENFCAFFTGLQCVAFSWQNGVLSELPNPLGGINSSFGGINRQGQIAGFAENGTRDPACLAAPPNGTGPLVLDFEAVLWGPGIDQFRQLPPLPNDTVGIALAINDLGEAVGISGLCSNTVMPPGTAGPHAVRWDADGSVHDLGSFGGTSNPTILGVGNAALAINDLGQIAGTSSLPGNQVNQPFVWTRQTGMQHLQLLPGDVVGAGLGMNNHGEIVGASITPGGLASGSPSAVLWRNGAQGGVTDLNTFLTPDSAFTALLTAFGINDEGQISGMGLTPTGEVHAFLAVPAAAGWTAAPAGVAPRNLVLPDSVRRRITGHGF